jgi:hypothetical protein
MEQERLHFGGRLRDKREERHLSLGDLARLTKIPERSLERLEAGRFDELPAEVFVRGFVRSYARAVGLDPEDMARRYGELTHLGGTSSLPATPPAARAESRAHSTGVGNLRSIPRASTQTGTSAVARAVAVPAASVPAALGSASETPAASPALAASETPAPLFPAPAIEVVEAAPAPAAKPEPNPEDSLSTLSRAILDAGRETRRLPLTLAVIILVIVATITMSLLLHRPSGGGSPITAISAPAGDLG